MNTREAFAAIPYTLVRGGLGVEGEDAQSGEQKLGQIPVAQLSVLPEILATLDDELEDKLNGAQCNLPTDKEAEIPADMGVLGGYRQALEVEHGLELGEQRNDEVLVSTPVGGGGIDLVEREAAQQLQDDVVDVAPEGKVSPRVGQA